MTGFSWMKALAAGALMGAMLVFPRQAAESALAALQLFAVKILPGLLPFSVCALLLTAGHTLPASALVLLALPAGSPVGARLFQNARLSADRSRRAAACTGVMSPMFFLYTVSAWMNDARAGRLLLAAHILSALLCGCFFPRWPRERISLPYLSAPQAVAQGAQAMLTVAACVALGTVSARMLYCALPGLPPAAVAAAQSLLEVSSGTKALIAQDAPLPAIAACAGFTGLSILLQNASFWQKNGLTLFDLTKIALLRAAIAFVLCLAALPLFARG